MSLLLQSDPLEHLLSLKNKAKANNIKRFFKTGKGDYAEDDIFIGVTVPELRSMVKDYLNISQTELNQLMKSIYHEARQLALFILVKRYQKAKEESAQEKIYQYYLRNKKHINNWDLVDCSAHHIVGRHLYKRDRSDLYDLFASTNLWEKRIAIVANWYLLKQDDFKDLLMMAKACLTDERDLIQKAIGWMLREMGKRDEKPLINFLDKHAYEMPRTMLRYAIERLDDKPRFLSLRGGR